MQDDSKRFCLLVKTSFSSLSYLIRLPVGYLKIDKFFAKELLAEIDGIDGNGTTKLKLHKLRNRRLDVPGAMEYNIA